MVISSNYWVAVRSDVFYHWELVQLVECLKVINSVVFNRKYIKLGPSLSIDYFLYMIFVQSKSLKIWETAELIHFVPVVDAVFF